MDNKISNRQVGSISGLILTIAIGFVSYFLFDMISSASTALSYDNIIDGIKNDYLKQIYWFFMNFTEADFFAGIFAGIGVIVGGFVAWRLSVKNSKYSGFDVCYGSSNMWPWVLASQVLSLTIAIFVLKYINWFDESTTWIPTFIAVVGAPPSIMLLYGPSIPALLTGSILGGIFCAPTAYWLANTLIPLFGLPGVVANVTAMAITGIIICYICKILPWVKAVPIKPHRATQNSPDNVYSASWSVRRALAEFSEPQFYGNEVASIFLLLGLAIDCIISGGMPAYGSNAIGGILLSQFVGAAVGIFLYAHKFENGGWYATYVPVVSVGPACVLMFGATIPVALVAGILGGILGGPVAEFFSTKMPEGVHGTNANVLSMALCTSIIAITMAATGLF